MKDTYIILILIIVIILILLSQLFGILIKKAMTEYLYGMYYFLKMNGVTIDLINKCFMEFLCSDFFWYKKMNKFIESSINCLDDKNDSDKIVMLLKKYQFENLVYNKHKKQFINKYNKKEEKLSVKEIILDIIKFKTYKDDITFKDYLFDGFKKENFSSYLVYSVIFCEFIFIYMKSNVIIPDIILIIITFYFSVISINKSSQIKHFNLMIFWVFSLITIPFNVYNNADLYLTIYDLFFLDIKIILLSIIGFYSLSISINSKSIDVEERMKNILFKYIKNKTQIIYLSFAFIIFIFVNIITFAMLLYSYNEKYFDYIFFDYFLASLNNYFTNNIFIQLRENDYYSYFLFISQSIIAFIYNTLLIGNIINYIIVVLQKKKKID